MMKKAKNVSKILIATILGLSVPYVTTYTAGGSAAAQTMQEKKSVLYLHELETNKSIGKNTLNSFIQKGNVIVVFYEDWCPPCKRMTPIFEEVAQHSQDITIIKVNRTLYRAIFNEYNLTTVPAILFFKNNALMKIQPSSVSQNELIHLIKKIYQK